MKMNIKSKIHIFSKIAFFITVFSALLYATAFFAPEAFATEMDLKGASDSFALALESGKSSVDITEYNIPKEKAGFLLQYSQSENPDIFWYPESVSYSFYEENSIISEISWENIYTDFSEIQKMKNQFEENVRHAVSICFERGMTDLEKIISAHDFLTETTEYKLTDSYSFGAYSVFVRNEGVCQGYSYAFKYLMDLAGIECYCVSSATLNHGWNIVKLDGEYYHVDVTTDDPIPTYNNSKISIGRETHEKLLCSDEKFNCGVDDVILWGDISLPECNSTLYDNAFFKDVVGTMEYLNGKWYYVEPDEYINGSRRVLKTDGYTTSVFMNMKDPVFSIASHDGYLYCSVKDTVYKVSVLGNSEVFCSSVGEIFGLSVRDNNLYYGVYRKKSYAICSKTLPVITDCIEGMSMNVDSQNFIVNIHVKSYKGNEDAYIKYTIGEKEKLVLKKDISSDGIIEISVPMEAFSSDILISFVCGEEKTEYRTSVLKYSEAIINGEFDKETKDLVKAMLLYGGIGNGEVPKGAFDQYSSSITDNSDEISYVKTEVGYDNGIVAKVHFSVIGDVEFKSSRDAKVEKDGLYYVITLKPFSPYDMEKTVLISAKNISVQFSLMSIASELDEDMREQIYFANEYGKALNEYITITMNK